MKKHRIQPSGPMIDQQSIRAARQASHQPNAGLLSEQTTLMAAMPPHPHLPHSVGLLCWLFSFYPAVYLASGCASAAAGFGRNKWENTHGGVLILVAP